MIVDRKWIVSVSEYLKVNGQDVYVPLAEEDTLNVKEEEALTR